MHPRDQMPQEAICSQNQRHTEQKPSRRRWDSDKSIDQRRQQRQKQIDELYQLAERTVNPGVKGQYLRKIKLYRTNRSLRCSRNGEARRG